MRTVTPTLAICGLAAIGFVVGLARPGDAPPEASGDEVTIAGFDFVVPARVGPGVDLIVVNTDTAPHTFTARNGSFDSGTLTDTPGGVTAPTTPGSYEVFCMIHPSMTATLVVE